MKKRRYKQLLASAIACSMVFSGVPATAYAAENGTVQEVVQEEDQSSTDSVSEDQSMPDSRKIQKIRILRGQTNQRLKTTVRQKIHRRKRQIQLSQTM